MREPDAARRGRTTAPSPPFSASSRAMRTGSAITRRREAVSSIASDPRDPRRGGDCPVAVSPPPAPDRSRPTLAAAISDPLPHGECDHYGRYIRSAAPTPPLIFSSHLQPELFVHLGAARPVGPGGRVGGRFRGSGGAGALVVGAGSRSIPNSSTTCLDASFEAGGAGRREGADLPVEDEALFARPVPFGGAAGFALLRDPRFGHGPLPRGPPLRRRDAVRGRGLAPRRAAAGARRPPRGRRPRPPPPRRRPPRRAPPRRRPRRSRARRGAAAAAPRPRGAGRARPPGAPAACAIAARARGKSPQARRAVLGAGHPGREAEDRRAEQGAVSRPPPAAAPAPPGGGGPRPTCASPAAAPPP